MTRAGVATVIRGLVVLGGFGGVGSSESARAASLPFTEVDAGPVTRIVDQCYSAAWGDYDRDGRPDLYLSTLFGTPAALFRNTAEGFERVTEAPLGSGSGSRAGAVWVDVNNDGRLDLFVGTTLGEDDRLYLGREGGGFIEAVGGPFEGSAGFGQSALTFDFDRDGGADLFVPNGGGWMPQANLLLRNRGAGGFAAVPDSPVATEILHSAGAAAGDFDGDGWPDLFVANIYVPNSLFRNRGDGSFEKVFMGPSDPALAGPVGAASGVWADYDNDGDLDLFTSHGEGNPLYRNDRGVLDRVDVPPLTPSTGFCVGAVFADFDNDGWLDVLVARRQAGQLLFRNTGEGGFEAMASGPIAGRSTGANGIAVADYDLDGDLDVLLTNWEGSGSPSLYRNDSRGNHWFRVRLQGERSNRDGLGAVVRVKATLGGRTFWQMRQIGGEDAQGSQELIAHFGLGDAVQVETLRVEWPSGLVQSWSAVAADQVFSAREQFVTPLEAIRLDRQTGLFEQRVRLETSGIDPTRALRLHVLDLPEDTTLVNATGTDDLGPYVQAPRPSEVPGGSVTFTLRFQRASRVPFPEPRYAVRAGEAPAVEIPVGDRFAVNRAERLPDGALLVEFNADAGARYRVEYSGDAAVWTPVASEIRAGGSKVIWVDRGLPETAQPPSDVTSRFYRVVRVTPPPP